MQLNEETADNADFTNEEKAARIFEQLNVKPYFKQFSPPPILIREIRVIRG